MAFLDPPAGERVPRGAVSWPLFAVAMLAIARRALVDEEELRWLPALITLLQAAIVGVAALAVLRLRSGTVTSGRLLRVLITAAFAAVTCVWAALRGPLPAVELAVAIGCALVAAVALGVRRT